MAVEIVGKSRDVERYRKFLHDQGVLTKRFLNTLSANGQQISPKPEGFRIFNSPIQKVFGESKKSLLEEDQKLFISGIANANIVDRMDERLEPAGVDLNNYMKNRVLLLDHLYVTSAVIGRVYELMPEENGVHFEAYIGDPKEAPLTQQQKDVRSLVAQKLVQTVSVGFMPLKIKAPVFDDEGKLQDPAVIQQWELLELSVVAVPANPGAVFEMKNSNSLNNSKTSYPSPGLTNSANGNKIIPKKSETKTSDDLVQKLIFDKESYDKESAVSWAKENDYRSENIEEKEDSIVLLQKDESDFDSSSFKTLEVTSGIRAYVGKLKTKLSKEKQMEEKLLELLEEMKGLKTLFASVGESLKELSDGNKTILSKLEGIDFMDEEEEEEEDKELEEDKDEKEVEEDKSEDEEDEEEEDEDDKELEEKVFEALEKQNEKIETISKALLSLMEKSN